MWIACAGGGVSVSSGAEVAVRLCVAWHEVCVGGGGSDVGGRAAQSREWSGEGLGEVFGGGDTWVADSLLPAERAGVGGDGESRASFERRSRWRVSRRTGLPARSRSRGRCIVSWACRRERRFPPGS